MYYILYYSLYIVYELLLYKRTLYYSDTDGRQQQRTWLNLRAVHVHEPRYTVSVCSLQCMRCNAVLHERVTVTCHPQSTQYRRP